jgi:hypothetical protein
VEQRGNENNDERDAVAVVDLVYHLAEGAVEGRKAVDGFGRRCTQTRLATY